MATVLNYVTVSGYSGSTSGDPIASVSLNGMTFQAGEEAMWAFVEGVSALVSQAQNVNTVVVMKYETVSSAVT
jgi:hypothetical protein